MIPKRPIFKSNSSIISNEQKQPSRDVLRKRCSRNMQQIYRRTPMSKCDFNKIAKQLYWNHTSAYVFSCKFATYFRTTFLRNTSGRLLLNEVLNWNYFDRSYQCHSNVRFTNTDIKKTDVFLNENSLFK